jgi:hypothetical protein
LRHSKGIKMHINTDHLSQSLRRYTLMTSHQNFGFTENSNAICGYVYVHCPILQWFLGSR